MNHSFHFKQLFTNSNKIRSIPTTPFKFTSTKPRNMSKCRFRHLDGATHTRRDDWKQAMMMNEIQCSHISCPSTCTHTYARTHAHSFLCSLSSLSVWWKYIVEFGSVISVWIYTSKCCVAKSFSIVSHSTSLCVFFLLQKKSVESVIHQRRWINENTLTYSLATPPVNNKIANTPNEKKNKRESVRIKKNWSK